jgi:hypothetical protein
MLLQSGLPKFLPVIARVGIPDLQKMDQALGRVSHPGHFLEMLLEDEHGAAPLRERHSPGRFPGIRFRHSVLDSSQQDVRPERPENGRVFVSFSLARILSA